MVVLTQNIETYWAEQSEELKGIAEDLLQRTPRGRLSISLGLGLVSLTGPL